MKWVLAAIFVLIFIIGVEAYMIRSLDEPRAILGFSTESKNSTGQDEVKIEEPESPTQAPSPTPTEMPSPTPTTISTPTITLVAPTPTSTPQPQFTSQQINEFIERYSGQYGVDPNVLRHIAVCESGFNPGAMNGPYAGLYQFSSSTWKNNRIPMGEDANPDLRVNAEEAVQTAAYLISKGKYYLWPNCKP